MNISANTEHACVAVLELAAAYGSDESPAAKAVTAAWRDVADGVGEMLGGITFAELVKQVKEKDRQPVVPIHGGPVRGNRRKR